MLDPEQAPPSLPVRASSEAPPLASAPDAALSPSQDGNLAPLPLADPFPPWSAWDVLAVLCAALAMVFVASMLMLGVARIVTSRQHVPVADLATYPIVIIGSQILAYPAVILFMMLLVRSRSDAGFWRSIHWNWTGPRTLGFLVSGMVFALAVDFVSRYLPIPKSLPIDKYFSELTGAYLMAAFGVTLAPLLEELFFRGMFYPLSRRAAGVTPAVLLTATLFAFIHGAQLGYAWAPLLSIFVVGVVFTVVREKTESVAASFLMHCGYNLTLFGLLWIGSDHFRHLEKVAN